MEVRALKVDIRKLIDQQAPMQEVLHELVQKCKILQAEASYCFRASC
jgi:hypothetical protein